MISYAAAALALTKAPVPSASAVAMLERALEIHDQWFPYLTTDEVDSLRSRLKAGGRPCLVASTVYGEGDGRVIAIVAFRDRVMLNSTVGRGLVELYYLISPCVARAVRRHRSVRAIVREGIVRPLAWICERLGGRVT